MAAKIAKTPIGVTANTMRINEAITSLPDKINALKGSVFFSVFRTAMPNNTEKTTTGMTLPFAIESITLAGINPDSTSPTLGMTLTLSISVDI